jgi:hypothetical protein
VRSLRDPWNLATDFESIPEEFDPGQGNGRYSLQIPNGVAIRQNSVGARQLVRR